MKVYIDNSFMCHTERTADYEEFDIPFFDGKCKKFVEGFRFIPEGREWKRDDGIIFSGEILTYGNDSVEVDLAQQEYEKQKLENCLEALQELGVET